ncbi:hypothetical protein [Gordonia sp. FQ]|uniref:hypothetical protein n=1 Tax=Gordonia sp. FQ TaxID=3446634 RepID=UPI003F82CE53
MRADDAIKYAAAKLAHCTDWACDSIGGSMCDVDHSVETDAIGEAVGELYCLAAEFGDPKTYSNGRIVQSRIWIVENELTTEVVWHPLPDGEGPQTWRGELSSGHPDLPSPGRYEVPTDPVTQQVFVKVFRDAGAVVPDA